MEPNTTGVDVKLRAVTGNANELPVSKVNLFEFCFSQPFSPNSPLVDAIPAELKHNRKSTLKERIASHKPIFVDGRTGASLSYKRLHRDALVVASTLINGPLSLRPAPLSSSDIKVNRGSVVSPIVLLHLPNSLQFVVLAYGIWASGLTFTAANPALTPPEIAHILSHSQPAAIVTTPAGLKTFQQAYNLLAPEIQARVNYPTGRNVFIVDQALDDYGASAASLTQQESMIVDGWQVQDWKALLPASAAPFEPPRYAGNEANLRAATILWSSGTSGKSKGVILSHAACGSALVAARLGMGADDDERLVGLPPMYHIFGMSSILLQPVVVGATVTIISKFDPNEYLRIVQESRATTLHIAPPVAVLFAKSPMLDNYDLSSVRGCISGGAPCGEAVIRGVHKRLGIMVKMGYGLSETHGVTNQVADHWHELERILGSTGVAFAGTEVKIADVDTGKAVGIDEVGEILIRSNFLLTSYLNNETATAEALDDQGWFHTGDAGRLDKDGNLWIVDRLKEVIKVKGFQVAPAELEDTLCGSPLVQDAAVCSIYHEDHATEYPRAYVVPFDKTVLSGGPAAKEFAKSVAKHVESKLAPYKWVRGGFVLVEAVPKNPSGKILRRLLKDVKGGHLVHAYEEKVRAKL